MKKRIVLIVIFAMILGALTAALAEAMPETAGATDRETVRAAQQRLIDLGYLKGGADGIAGPKTHEAVRAFQAGSGMMATGELDEATLSALQEAMPASVTDVQQRLIDLGYLNGTADGIWGKRSAAALKLFQQLHGFEGTGISSKPVIDRLFSNDAQILPATLRAGDSGDGVARLQRRLIQFGFLTGQADGDYGASTAAAVRDFQQRMIDQGLGQTYDLTADGAATPITQHLMLDPICSTYLHDVAAGDTGDEALRIERRLVALGYMDMAADDTLDSYAVEALALFKDTMGIASEVAADRKTIDALFLENAPRAERCAPHDIAGGDSGMAVRAVEEALYYGGMMTKLPNGNYDKAVGKALESLHQYLVDRGDTRTGLFADPAALSKEAQAALTGGLLGYVTDVDRNCDSKAEAARVQRRLYTLYYLSKEGIDGLVGSDSRSAIKSFQAANGLIETGAADAATQEILFSARAVPKPLPYRVEVSIERQVVDVYQLNDQKQYDLVQSFTCSTGLNNSTPRGIFLDGHPVNRWHFFKNFNCWAQYSFVIVNDIMFHSVIYSSNNENSLRTSSVNNLGSPASHGCIRLQVEDAKWLFEHCKRGSVVVLIR